MSHNVFITHHVLWWTFRFSDIVPLQMMQWVFLYIHILYIWRYIQVPRNKFLEEFDILWNCWVRWIGQLYSWYIAKLLSILPVFLYPNQHQELSHFMVTHLDNKTGTFTFSFPFQRTIFFLFLFSVVLLTLFSCRSSWYIKEISLLSGVSFRYFFPVWYLSFGLTFGGNYYKIFFS